MTIRAKSRRKREGRIRLRVPSERRRLLVETSGKRTTNGATNGMRALGLPADKFEENTLVLARLLDGQTKDYEIASGRTVETMEPVYGSDIERSVVVEQFHNAFRRITTNWDSVLNRKVMDSNLERLLPMAAHAVRIERERRET